MDNVAGLLGDAGSAAAGTAVDPDAAGAAVALPRGMWVVQTWPPPASVESRRTSTPSRRAKTPVSWSQKAGKAEANPWMGQCPWQSWTLSIVGRFDGVEEVRTPRACGIPT